MRRYYGRNFRRFQNPGSNHGLGAAGRHFFAGLKDDFHVAAPLCAIACQQHCRAQCHGSIAIMPTGMHHLRHLRGIYTPVFFHNRQSIHVCANSKGRSRPRTAQYANYPGPGYTSEYLPPCLPEYFSRQATGLFFLKTQFRILMDVTAPLAHVRK